ncbi:MAG: protein-L-isoaspartate O-methyltransferase [Azoarcus sp.]|jgi:protein-L-isoaspartate(D-aspartate) O-methyltransferase|nr:protein-L-isoaspartate O-methyltransferase [Azoarcus sp.]
MNFEHARFNMVEQQIRPWDVVDEEVRKLLMAVKREDYVPNPVRTLAFADIEVPLPCGQIMLKPVIEGRVLQALALKPGDSVLEVGTGSGYFAALLAAGADWVRTIEIKPALAKFAQNNFIRNKVKNVVVEEGDGTHGWSARAPYDVIVVSGGLPELPRVLLEQLRSGGRLFAFVGEAPVMKGRLVIHADEENFHATDLFETVVPMLENAPRLNGFRF